MEEVEMSKDDEEEDGENEDTEEDEEEEEAEGDGEGSINRIGSSCEYESCPGKFGGALDHEQELDTVTCVNCQHDAKWIHKVKINDMKMKCMK